jgi:very-short-patch-repair endonuclease
VQNKPAYGALVDPRLAALAAAQHGVVSRGQLYELGCSRGSITRRVEKRRLLRVNRGVYAVGHNRLTAKGLWMAAVLACGRDAVLSHLDAAALHDLRQIGSGLVHVTAPGKHQLKGLRAHRARLLNPDDCTVVDSIPVTTVALTYLDLAEILNHGRLIDVLETGQRQHKLDVNAIESVIARNPGRHGVKPLQDAIHELTDEPPLIQSPTEQAFREIIRSHGFPVPQFNVYVEGELMDVVWPEHRLVVEVDSWGFHRGKRSFENDRRRGNKLVRHHWRLVRFTHDQVMLDPAGVAAELSELLSDGPWPPPVRSGP